MKRYRQLARRALPVLVWLAAGLGLGGLLAAGVIHLRQSPAATDLVGWGTVEEAVPVQALVIRQEQVEVAPISGVLLRLAGEGQRVAAGAAVAQIINPDAQVALAARGRAVEEAWSRFEKESETQRQAAGREVKDLQVRTEGLLTSLREAAVAADADGMQQAWSGLGTVWGKLERARQEQVRLERERALLLSEQAKVTSLTRQAEVRLTATDAGMVSFQVDGLEPVLRPNRLDLVDIGLADNPPAPLPPAGERVEAGQPVFRVVDSDSVILACRLSRANAEAVARRGSVSLRLAGPPSREVQGRIISLGAAEINGYRTVFVQVATAPGDALLSDRVVRGTIVVRTAQGPRVPVEALEPEPNSPVPAETGLGLYVLEAGRPVWIPVTVLATNGQQAVVAGVHVGATLVTEGTQRRIR